MTNGGRCDEGTGKYRLLAGQAAGQGGALDRLSTVRPSKKIQGRLYRNSKRLSQHDGEGEVRQDSIEGVGEIFDGWWDGVSAKVG